MAGQYAVLANAVVGLGVTGQAADVRQRMASLCSPLIFRVLALALRRAGMLGDRPVLRTAVGTGSPWRNFFRVAAPLALVIGIALNALAVLAMLSSDIGTWKRGALPLTTLPLDPFSAEKRPLLVMLYTTAVEQQLSLMPLFVIMAAGSSRTWWLQPWPVERHGLPRGSFRRSSANRRS
ncbi:hypothetical protein [Pseudomonas oryzihabitans]|uniref:hypothetical protein n=1 Tax=Pseudomonas oryzihabitans TaxID=47885 RepID=UPI001642993D|nr:hypothetical protein [Pseudomonas oryzihabitans]